MLELVARPATPIETRDHNLLEALKRLDQRLRLAIDRVKGKSDPGSPLSSSLLQGTTVATLSPSVDAASWDAPGSNNDIEQTLSWDAICKASPRWSWLRAAFGLSTFDLDVTLLCLGPEVDRRYERAYAYLLDDSARRRPSVALALELFSSTDEDRIEARSHFGVDAPLLRQRLVRLIPEPYSLEPTLLDLSLKLDEQIVDALLSQGGLDRRLAPFCRLSWPDVALDSPAMPTALLELRTAWRVARAAGHSLILYLSGPQDASKRHAAAAVSADLGLGLIEADLSLIPSDADPSQTFEILLREARFQDAILFFDGLDELRGRDQSSTVERLLTHLVSGTQIVLLAGALPWAATTMPTGALIVPLAAPDAATRRSLWKDALGSNGVALSPDDLDVLASRFRLRWAQIADVAAQARFREPARDVVFAAARTQASRAMEGLATHVTSRHRWDDLVVPPGSLDLLREIAQRLLCAQRVLRDWGFGEKSTLGLGTSVLFAGPSGTGKTLAAEVLSNEVGLDLYRIDLSTVVSKYIGETEKNLERIFHAAESASVILFFDEADAIFGKRSEVRDAHDRYANLEIAYLLQRMEQYEGLAILATNLREHLDEAFIRRLDFIVDFHFPDEAQRRRLWEIHLPAEAPREPALDLGYLAGRFRLSGGNIRNAALAAGFLAASADAPISMSHLLRAVQREYQKLGKVLPEADTARVRGEPDG